MDFKVLLVDDQQLVLDGLKEQLNWERFHGTLCGTVTDGAEALSFIQECRPDAIISDIKMPHMDGIELARQIDESPLLSGIPIILLSGYREFEYAKGAMRYHVNHYILKPVTRKKIEELENILLELYHARASSRAKLLELTDNSYQQEIASALRHNDINRIEDFFKSPLYRECINGKYCDIMGMQLLSLLYNYLEDIHFTPNALNTSRAHTMKLFSELPNCALKANYVESTYFDVLNVIHQQKGNNTEALYRYAIQFIDQHYTDPDFTISFLASEMNISLSYLSTLFKQSSGRNLNNYITEKRLEYAKTLLRSLQYSIREIAHLSGYDDAGYFSSLFRRKVGMNPTEYRNCQI